MPKILGNTTATTMMAEQTYNPQSIKPQSGKAVAEAIAKLLGSAPENLDTLEELAKALNEDENFSASVLAEIAKKADTSYVDNKVANIKITTDDKLSYTSTNPVQNKVITSALNTKADSSLAFDGYYDVDSYDASYTDGLYKAKNGIVIQRLASYSEGSSYYGVDQYWYTKGEVYYRELGDEGGWENDWEKVSVSQTDLDKALWKKINIKNGDSIVLANNTVYYAPNKINSLTVKYPNGDFLSNIEFTLASEGEITIVFPESKYIGTVPTFANGETWEISIKNGVVIGGLVE